MIVEEQIRELKKRFRLAMNGVVSTDMRLRGVHYEVNFGVSLPTLRNVSADLPRDLSLAETLWAENVRECRIVATLITPDESFTPERLDEWIARPFPAELAEQLSHNLLVRLPFALSWACSRVDSPREEVRRLAFLTLGKRSACPTLSAENRTLLLHSGLSSIVRSVSMLNPVFSAWEKQLVEEPSAFESELKGALPEYPLDERLTNYLLDYFSSVCAETNLF